ncbi:MAG: shikimate dehydrogenase, partial [Gammaproteobacteria bacterium]|nr:shikimate dehydrogenase [Gammaproteobacteria bacterium]
MTDRYGVIGHPIAHSKSPVIHRLFAEKTGQDLSYDAIDIPPEELGSRVRQLLAEGFRGLNVTVPHKTEVVKLTSRLTSRAELA